MLSSRKSAEQIVTLVNRTMFERLGDKPGSDDGDDSIVLRGECSDGAASTTTRGVAEAPIGYYIMPTLI